jgi:hypothetical protein
MADEETIRFLIAEALEQPHPDDKQGGGFPSWAESYYQMRNAIHAMAQVLGVDYTPYKPTEAQSQ